MEKNQPSTENQEPNLDSLNQEKVSGVQTMKYDYAHAVQDTKTTLADVAIEAQTRRRNSAYGIDTNKVHVEKKSHTTLYAVLVFMLLAASIFLIWYKFSFTAENPGFTGVTSLSKRFVKIPATMAITMEVTTR